MTRFRASDEQIDREIAVLEHTVHLRVRRAAAELRELERDLRELRRERGRRKAARSASEGEVAGPITGES